jgi:hypothetical protein
MPTSRFRPSHGSMVGLKLRWKSATQPTNRTKMKPGRLYIFLFESPSGPVWSRSDQLRPRC